MYFHRPHPHWSLYDSQRLQCHCGRRQYLFLSLVVPTAYVGAADAVFGREQGRIRRWAVVLVWLLLLALTAAVKVYLGEYWKAAPFWEWPTISRDLVFIVAMYVEISLIMLVSYVISSWMPTRKDVG